MSGTESRTPLDVALHITPRVLYGMLLLAMGTYTIILVCRQNQRKRLSIVAPLTSLICVAQPFIFEKEMPDLSTTHGRVVLFSAACWFISAICYAFVAILARWGGFECEYCGRAVIEINNVTSFSTMTALDEKKRLEITLLDV